MAYSAFCGVYVMRLGRRWRLGAGGGPGTSCQQRDSRDECESPRDDLAHVDCEYTTQKNNRDSELFSPSRPYSNECTRLKTQAHSHLKQARIVLLRGDLSESIICGRRL